MVGMTSFQSPNQLAAAELRAEMARQGKQKSELAAVLDVLPHTAGRRYSGEVALNISEIITLADWLGIPPERFLPGSTESRAAAS